jgi:hypothetical protein
MKLQFGFKKTLSLNSAISIMVPLATFLFVALVALMPHTALADATISDTDTVANVPASTIPAVSLTLGVSQVKASTTLTVVTAPTTATSITIGTCVISFATTTSGSPASDTNACGTTHTATIRTATGATDIARTTTEIATAIIAIGTSATSTTHGTLAITASTSATSFVVATNGDETSATTINFTDGTSNKITNPYNVTGVIGVAASSTIAVPAGMVANATDHSITIDGVVINLGTSAQTAAQIATAIAAVDFSSGATQSTLPYSVTNPTSGNIKFTRTNATSTTNGSLTLADASYGTTAQVASFAPSGMSGNLSYTVTATINGAGHSFTSTDSSLNKVVEGLNTALSGNGVVTCTTDDITVTCTAVTAGTSFTHSSSITANITTVAGSVGGNSGGGGGGGGGGYVAPTTIPLTPDQQKAAQIATIKTELASLIRQLILILSAQLTQLQATGTY